MKEKKRISTWIIMLILFFYTVQPVFSLVLTENIHTIQDGGAEILLGDGVLAGPEIYNSINAGLGLGISTDFSIWFTFNYLSRNTPNPLEGTAGDGTLHLRYYLGDYAERRLHLVLHSSLRIPAGNNAYASDEWKNTSFGNHELTSGLAGRYDLLSSWFLHTMISYTFRQERDKDFYGGFHLNPLKGETYRSFFGLNPFREGSFLHYRRLANDYITLATGISTDRYYPFIPSCEVRWSITLARGNVKRYPVLPFGVDPLVFSLEARYFFSSQFYVGCYCAINVIPGQDGTVLLPGVSCGLEF